MVMKGKFLIAFVSLAVPDKFREFDGMVRRAMGPAGLTLSHSSRLPIHNRMDLPFCIHYSTKNEKRI